MNEEFDIQAVWDHRREAAADSLRSASPEEIKQLINTIFTDRTTHPWFE
jgi:membrane-associated HD superfamily phosphohydrolase